MRRLIFMLIVIFAAWTVVPVVKALAQQQDEPTEEEKKQKKDEWSLKQAPLPNRKNAGPCPYVKVLYDAGRYIEFKDNEEASSAVAYTGEIQDLGAECSYKANEPIHNKIVIQFGLGRGPQGASPHKIYRYWVAVTHRNREVLAKEEFDLPVNFPAGADRIAVQDKINDIIIPRANSSVSGENFEILVGFDVTPAMAEFNREGKRFRLNAGAPTVAEAQSANQ